MAMPLDTFARERGIKNFMVSFTDLYGGQRAKLVPAGAIAGVQERGASFAGYATWLDLTPAHPDMLAIPDPEMVIQLPWKPEVAWIASDCAIGNRALEQAPRNVLKRMVQLAAEAGLRVRTGVEPEFFLLSPEGDRIADPLDIGVKPCYDQQAIMRRYDVISEVSDHMLALGWEPYQSDHEDGSGQFEMNWKYDDALRTADKFSFFKFMLKSVAEKHGLRATFMPKPFPGITGSGCHVHISCWSPDGATNTFADDSDELGLSQTAYHFIGGLIRHAGALTAICNPTVNSYKRINAQRCSSGATWAPQSMTWSGNNRTHMIRVPGPGRIELRLPDGAANPYLLQAIVIAAGLGGIRDRLDPGPRSDVDMYRDAHDIPDAEPLPRNLLDALRAYRDDQPIRALMGEEFSKAYLKLREIEWTSYMQHFTRWEVQHTLDV